MSVNIRFTQPRDFEFKGRVYQATYEGDWIKILSLGRVRPSREEPNTMISAITLADCPIGLFTSESGELCLKTEYHSNEGRIDAYIVSSGERFWGSPSQTIQSQRNSIVTPVDPASIEKSNPVLAARLFAVVRAGSAIVRFVRSGTIRADEDDSVKVPTRLKDLRALTYAIESIATDDGWLPIDGAPKKGRFMVKGPTGYNSTNEVHIETVRRDPEWRGERFINDAGDNYTDGWPLPTHWRPLEGWL